MRSAVKGHGKHVSSMSQVRVKIILLSCLTRLVHKDFVDVLDSHRHRSHARVARSQCFVIVRTRASAKTHEVFGKGGAGVRPYRGAGCPRSLFSSFPKSCGGNALGRSRIMLYYYSTITSRSEIHQ